MRFPDTPPAGCQLTYADARELCDEAVAQFAPEHICVAQAVMIGEVDGDIHDETIELANEEAWILYYTRELDMPITYNSIGPESNMDFVIFLDEVLKFLRDYWICLVCLQRFSIN